MTDGAVIVRAIWAAWYLEWTPVRRRSRVLIIFSYAAHLLRPYLRAVAIGSLDPIPVNDGLAELAWSQVVEALKFEPVDQDEFTISGAGP